MSSTICACASGSSSQPVLMMRDNSWICAGDEALQARRLVGEEVDDVAAHVHAKLRGLRRVVRQELRERRRREELRVGTRGAVEDSLVGSDREGDDSDGCARNC